VTRMGQIWVGSPLWHFPIWHTQGSYHLPRGEPTSSYSRPLPAKTITSTYRRFKN
jgi:hypothetical protein